jgi:hypothetical protein
LTITGERIPAKLNSRGIGPATTGVDWMLGALVTVSASIGLLVEDVYTGPDATAEMLRGYDVVTLAVGLSLIVATRQAWRGSALAHLLTTSLVAYLVYTYAYYLFGTGFNDLFLLHVAAFGTGLTALLLTLADLDASSIAECFDVRTRVRVVAGILGALALALGGMWVYFAVDNAVNGTMPEGSQLVETDTVVRLGMALDLALLVPLYAVAAVLLWRRAAWGYPLGAIALVAGLLHQVSYLVAMPFQVAADVEGAVAFDPGEPVIVLAYAVAATVLFNGLERSRRPR